MEEEKEIEEEVESEEVYSSSGWFYASERKV